MFDFNDHILEILKWVKYISLFPLCKPQCLGGQDDTRNCSLRTQVIFHGRHKGAAVSLNYLQVWTATQVSGGSLILLLFRRCTFSIRLEMTSYHLSSVRVGLKSQGFGLVCLCPNMRSYWKLYVKLCCWMYSLLFWKVCVIWIQNINFLGILI